LLIPPPFNHQKKSIEFFKDKSRTFDASDPGTGKTRVFLEVFAERRRQGGGAALIIAPKSLLDAAWREDIWKFTPHLKVSIAYATNRDNAFRLENADLYITNTDAVSYLVKKDALFFTVFDTLCIDEISAFKHPTSNRSKAIAEIKNYFPYRHGMSGTPNSNTILDIWHQMYIIDDGARLGDSYYRFRHATTTPVAVAKPRMTKDKKGKTLVFTPKKWVDKPGIEKTIASVISDITIRHAFKDCVDIPPNTMRIVHYTMPVKQLRLYEDMERDMIIENNGDIINAPNAAVLYGKLLQISSGAAYAVDGEPTIVEKSRYELTADLIMEREHTLVFFLWQHQRDLIIEALKKRDRNIEYAVLDKSAPERLRGDYVKGFQNGFYKTLLCHPKTAAHGLTLTKAYATIWPSPTIDLEFWKQGYHRIVRAGQDKMTETILICARDTKDEYVFKTLVLKDTRMSNFLGVLNYG
jgi:SNF2 family DNA or RNA helicase